MDVDEKEPNTLGSIDLNLVESDILDAISNPFNKHHVLFDDDDEELFFLTELCKEQKKTKKNKLPPIGRGNARSGKRNPYVLYESSEVFKRITVKEHIFKEFAMFKQEDFHDLMMELSVEWNKPRKGVQIRK
eukprot:936720_1